MSRTITKRVAERHLFLTSTYLLTPLKIKNTVRFSAGPIISIGPNLNAQTFSWSLIKEVAVIFKWAKSHALRKSHLSQTAKTRKSFCCCRLLRMYIVYGSSTMYYRTPYDSKKLSSNWNDLAINIHPFNLHPEKWFEGYPVKSTQLFIGCHLRFF